MNINIYDNLQSCESDICNKYFQFIGLDTEGLKSYEYKEGRQKIEISAEA